MKRSNATSSADDSRRGRDERASPGKGLLASLKAACRLVVPSAWGGERSRARLRPARLGRYAHRRKERAVPDDGLQFVLNALSHPDDAVRLGALRVLSEFSEEYAGPLVARAIHDLSPTVRCAAARAAIRLGGMRAVPALFVALEDEDAEVRRSAAHAVRVLMDEASDGEDAELTAKEIEAMKRRWKQARLRELVPEPSTNSRTTG